MILNDERSALDEALNTEVSICVLRGAEDSDPGKVHVCMDDGGWGEEPWQRWFLVTNSNLLTTEENGRWFNNNPASDYAFLGRKTKATTSNGAAGTDLLDVGDCDYLTYIDKFAQADQQ
jgi:hypothetical protein